VSRRLASLCLCLVCCVASAGCELIADFDRDKIPGATTAGQGGSTPPTPDAATAGSGGEDDAGTE
jgi:hypothetical protein